MVTGHMFMAMSLDGFVAREDHSLDWLMKQKTEGEEHGYEAFMNSVDGLVMGSGSFRTVLTFDAWPYRKPVIVLSKTLCSDDIPKELVGKVRIVNDQSPTELMTSLSKEGWERAYIDGGKIIQSFIKAGLIEEMTVTLIPILIGSGKRMFGALGSDVDLQLLEVEQFPSGLISTKYKVI